MERPHPRALHRRHRGGPQRPRPAARCSPAEQRAFEELSLIAAHAPRRALGRPRPRRGAGRARRATRAAAPCSRSGAGCWPTRSPPESPPVVCTDDRRVPGRAPDAPQGENDLMEKVVRLCRHRGLHLPLGRDLRRLPLDLRLRAARGQHAAQREERLVAFDGPAARRRGRARRRHPVAPGRVGRLGPPGHLHRPPGGLPQLPRALARGQDRRCLPQLRLDRPDRGPGVQPDVQDARRPGGGRGPRGLPAARDGPGHVPQLLQRPQHDAQEAALRHRPGGQVVPQRDHAAELRLPHPRVRADGDGVLRAAGREPAVVRVLVGRAVPLVRRARHPRGQAPPAPPRPGRAVALLARHGRRGVPLPLGLGRARGDRQPGRLRPVGPRQGLGGAARLLRPGRPTSATSPT